MTGKSHKAIGTAVGAAFVAYGITQGDASLALGLVTAPMGAMLPDIDHGRTKIGKIRKHIAKASLAVAVLVFLGMILYLGLVVQDFTALIAMVLGVVVPVIILFILSYVTAVKKAFGFVTKHRGIMHTLLLPVIMFVASTFIYEKYILTMVYGFIAGYTSHVIADCFTKKGCPILFPIYWRNVNIANITTGSFAEKVCVVILICLIVISPFLIFYIRLGDYYFR